MKVTFTKKLHGNYTIRFIDIYIDNGADNDYSCTMILMTAEQSYNVCRYTEGMDINLIYAIQYVANCHIMLASTSTLDFCSDYSNEYYHLTDCSSDYFNFLHDKIPLEYLQFVNRLMAIMAKYQ